MSATGVETSIESSTEPRIGPRTMSISSALNPAGHHLACRSWFSASSSSSSIVSSGSELLADSLSLGGPTGIYVQSRSASWLASLRSVIIVPVELIFTVFFVFLCDPPWSSV